MRYWNMRLSWYAHIPKRCSIFLYTIGARVEFKIFAENCYKTCTQKNSWKIEGKKLLLSKMKKIAAAAARDFIKLQYHHNPVEKVGSCGYQ